MGSVFLLAIYARLSMQHLDSAIAAMMDIYYQMVRVKFLLLL